MYRTVLAGYHLSVAPLCQECSETVEKVDRVEGHVRRKAEVVRVLSHMPVDKLHVVSRQGFDVLSPLGRINTHESIIGPFQFVQDRM